MSNNKFVALLRGINVGGKNIIGKDDLKRCFEDLGFDSVLTYIQSGNILFRTGARSAKGLTTRIERQLRDRFSYDAQAVVLSYAQYMSALAAAPGSWGDDDQRKHNALFTLRGITPEDVMSQLPPPNGKIEKATTGPGVVFWSASRQHLAKTTVMKLARLKLYQQLTVRNHNTVFKIRDLFDAI